MAKLKVIFSEFTSIFDYCKSILISNYTIAVIIGLVSTLKSSF